LETPVSDTNLLAFEDVRFMSFLLDVKRKCFLLLRLQTQETEIKKTEERNIEGT